MGSRSTLQIDQIRQGLALRWEASLRERALCARLGDRYAEGLSDDAECLSDDAECL
jgi:hypothetical protein